LWIFLAFISEKERTHAGVTEEVVTEFRNAKWSHLGEQNSNLVKKQKNDIAINDNLSNFAPKNHFGIKYAKRDKA
jgi:hypothetical protein